MLLPGQQITVQVTLDPANLTPGPVSKSVWVYVKGRNTPVATLTMTGTLVPAARLAPTTLDFGHAASGSGPTVLLAVAWNGAALSPGSRCRLVSTNPDVSVTPAPAPAGASGETYRCTLSSRAHLGELEGSIQAIITPPGEGPVVVGEAPLRGDVRGDVAATPAVVAFGTVPVGKSAPRRIELALARAETPSVSSASPYLTARLGPITSRQPDHPFGAGPLKTSDHSASGEPNPFLAWLDITLSSKAPAGPLATELTVTTGTGQRLRVPVFALIVPAEAKR